MKRNSTISLISATLLVGLGVGVMLTTDTNSTENTTPVETTALSQAEINLENITTNESSLSDSLEITVEEISALFESKETFALVVKAEGCGYCEQYQTETLAHYKESETGLPLYTIEMYSSFQDSEEFGSFLRNYRLEFEGTPTTYLIKEGEVLNTLLGAIPQEALMDAIRIFLD